MALFYYQTVDHKGKKQNGVIEAPTQEQAKQTLRQQKIFVTKFSAQRATPFFTLFSQELSLLQVTLFTTQLAELTKAKLPLFQSLTSLCQQAEGTKSEPILHSLINQIKEGQSLSEAMALYPKSFPPLYRALIKAGERVGTLDKSLEKVAALYTKSTKLKKKLTTALLYPMILAAFSCIVILAMLLFVIPSLETLFEQENVNRFTACVMGASHLLTQKWHFFAAFLVMGISSIVYCLRKPSWHEYKERLLLRLPLVRSVIIKVAVARFTRTLASLLEGGVSMIEALRITKAVLPLSFFAKEITLAEQKIIEGSVLSKELEAISWMPRLAAQMIAVGEESGTLQSMLESVAQMYEEEVDKTLTRLTELAQPLILLVMGAIVGIIMLAVLLPITDATHIL